MKHPVELRPLFRCDLFMWDGLKVSAEVYCGVQNGKDLQYVWISLEVGKLVCVCFE